MFYLSPQELVIAENNEDHDQTYPWTVSVLFLREICQAISVERFREFTCNALNINYLQASHYETLFLSLPGVLLYFSYDN